MFIMMFVYGADGKPTWYVASNTQYVSGTAVKYTGPLYTVTGCRAQLAFVASGVF